MLGSGLTLTRNKNLECPNSNGRIAFDKNELKQRYKIKPVHWFNMKHFWQAEFYYFVLDKTMKIKRSKYTIYLPINLIFKEYLFYGYLRTK